jgi:membrane protein YqaA with SNARE-associated domain
MMKKLYDWTMSLSASPHAPIALGAIAFAESSFFPIPPDVILVPMTIAQPKMAWRYAAICTIASVAGGARGAAIYKGAMIDEASRKMALAVFGRGSASGLNQIKRFTP